MTYKIMMTSWGGTRKEFHTDLSYKEALEICESNDWIWESWEGGYIWDLEIEEEH